MLYSEDAFFVCGSFAKSEIQEKMKDNTRKITYADNSGSNPLFSKRYEARKPDGDAEDSWYRHGRIYDNIKKLFDLIKGDGGLEFIMEEKIRRDIWEYKEIKYERKQNYLREQNKTKRKF